MSSFTKNRILKQLQGYPEQDTFILPDTVDTHKFKPGAKSKYLMHKLNLKDEDRVILTIARLSKKEKHKGYDKVILVMKEMIKEIPNLKYVLGGSGSDMERVQRMIRDNRLEDKVILAGPISPDETVDYYNLCDIFVMPSRQEGFGIVFIEALACGKPVIAGNKDGSRDALLNGQLGTLVDHLDTQEIALAIRKVLRKEVSPNLLDAGYLRQRTSEFFGLERFTQRVRDVFDGAVLQKTIGKDMWFKPAGALHL